MAPAASKQAKPGAARLHTSNGMLDKIRAAFAAQLRELGQDLLEIGSFVHGCIQEVGNRLQDSATPFVDAILELLNLLKRVLSDVECSSGGTSPSENDEGGRGNKPGNLESAFPMIFVGHMICLLYSSFVFVYMPAAGLSLMSPTSVLFHATMFMTLASYVRVHMTEPGTLPAGPAWRTQDAPPPHLHERKAKEDGPRWCRKSLVYKPDRSHFCSNTGRVVLRMDHHCPWVGNTIGFANHKYFLLFVIYTTLSCLIANGDMSWLLAHARLPPSTAHLLFGSNSLLLMLSSILVPFTGFHLWLLSRNMTTIEFCSRTWPRGHEEQTLPNYDLGFVRNLIAMLGADPLYWLLPVASTPGDGLSFPLQGDGDGLGQADEEEEVIDAIPLFEAEPGLLQQSPEILESFRGDGASTTASDCEEKHWCACPAHQPRTSTAVSATSDASSSHRRQDSLQVFTGCPSLDCGLAIDACTYIKSIFCKNTSLAVQGRSNRVSIHRRERRTAARYDPNSVPNGASSTNSTYTAAHFLSVPGTSNNDTHLGFF